MSASRGRGLRPGGVVRALIRLVLLVGIGFGAGLLIGVLSEEPELLAGHLRGEGESIALTLADGVGEGFGDGAPVEPLDSDEEVLLGKADRDARVELAAKENAGPSLPDVAAALPPVAAALPDVPTAPLEQQPAPTPVAQAEAKKDPVWAIQVGAFSDEAAARELAKALDGKGYPTELLESTANAQRWRVRIQPVRGEAKAREMAVQLKRVEGLPTWVIPMEDRARR